jgi:hypothetical protein
MASAQHADGRKLANADGIASARKVGYGAAVETAASIACRALCKAPHGVFGFQATACTPRTRARMSPRRRPMRPGESWMRGTGLLWRNVLNPRFRIFAATAS